MKRVFAIVAMAFGLTSICMADCGESLLLFGDSYFDTGAGNAVANAQSVPQPNPAPCFFDNRQSNGPLWIDYTSAALDIPNVDYAVAGSQTGNNNVNNNALGGLFQQIQRFSASGSKISDRTIVVVDGAGNDYLALIPNQLTPNDVATATASALSNLGTAFQNLQALGADKIIVWNLGDLGMLPLFNNPVLFPALVAAKSLFSGASAAFNANLPTQVVRKLNVFKKPQQVFIFDAFTAFNETAAELQAQGIDLSQIAVVSQYGGTPPCTPTGLDPAHLAFYDQVYPTTYGWSLFAPIFSAYLDTLIEAPRFMAAQTDLALETAKAHRDLVENHFRTLNTERYIYDYWCGCCCDCDCGQNCIQVYVDGEGKWGETQTRCGALGLDYNTGLGLFGVDLRVTPDLLLGASFTAQTTSAKVHESRGRIKLVDYVPTVYASYFGPCYFVDLASSLHCYNFKNLQRHTLGKTAKGHTDALGAETSLTLGYVSTCNCFTLMPMIGFDFEELTIQGYKERHAGYLNMKIHRQHQRSFVARIGGQFFWKAFDGCFLPFGEIVYEYECLRNSKRIGPMFVRSDDHAQDFHHTGQPKRNVLKYSLGVDARLSDCIVGNISYLGETNFDNYNNAVRAQLDIAF